MNLTSLPSTIHYILCVRISSLEKKKVATLVHSRESGANPHLPLPTPHTAVFNSPKNARRTNPRPKTAVIPHREKPYPSPPSVFHHIQGHPAQPKKLFHLPDAQLMTSAPPHQPARTTSSFRPPSPPALPPTHHRSPAGSPLPSRRGGSWSSRCSGSQHQVCV